MLPEPLFEFLEGEEDFPPDLVVGNFSSAHHSRDLRLAEAEDLGDLLLGEEHIFKQVLIPFFFVHGFPPEDR